MPDRTDAVDSCQLDQPLTTSPRKAGNAERWCPEASFAKYQWATIRHPVTEGNCVLASVSAKGFIFIMRYETPDPLHPALLPGLIAAEDGLARLDERAARHAVAEGFRERGQFFDAAAALWVAGELVHVEDLVLHDSHMDARAPSHELTIAHAVLRARRRLDLASRAGR